MANSIAAIFFTTEGTRSINEQCAELMPRTGHFWRDGVEIRLRLPARPPPGGCWWILVFPAVPTGWLCLNICFR